MDLGPHAPMGDGELHKWIVRPSWLQYINNSSECEGEKIYEAWPGRLNKNTNTIYFWASWSENGRTCSIKLNVRTDNHTLNAFFAKYCKYEDLNGHAKLVFITKGTYLLGGIWDHIECIHKEDCAIAKKYGCKNCLGTYITYAGSIDQLIHIPKELQPCRS